MSETNNNLCDICKKGYSNHNNLKKHIKKFHLNKFDELMPTSTPEPREIRFKYPCNVCSKNFNHLRHLTYHKKRSHDIKSAGDTTFMKLECPLCACKGSCKSELIEHFQRVHNVTIETVSVEFDSMAEYDNWKSKVELETKSKFIRPRGTITSKSKKVTLLVCHRSGKYKSTSKGHRHLKRHGSRKINGYCPAEISVTYENVGKIKVKFTKTHVGHHMDIGHLYLSSSERETIAGMIAAQIPFSSILDDVRGSITNSELERIHLLTRKDLYNIETSYNLSSVAIRHEKDAISVDAWAKEMQEIGSVLLYMPEDETSKQDIVEEKNKLEMLLKNVLNRVDTMKDIDIIEKHLNRLPALLEVQKLVKSALVSNA